MTVLAEIVTTVGTVAVALFAGAAIYISLVEHPARERCGPTVAVAEFVPSYRRAFVMQGVLVVVAGLAGIARWAMLGDTGWLAGGVVLLAMVPYTFLLVEPVNKRLMDPAVTARPDEAVALLCRWGRLHSVRSLAGGIALGLFLAGR